MPHRSFRTRLLVIAGLAALAAGCGGGTGSGDVEKISIVQSTFDVAVTNNSGRALFQVRSEIEPTGPASHFTNTIARMENGEKRLVAHNLFTDRDGVPFSPRNVRASRIIVTAKDIDGKELRVEMPWKK
jgi:hypothetical protein